MLSSLAGPGNALRSFAKVMDMQLWKNGSYELQKLYGRLPPEAKGHSARVAVYMQLLTERVLVTAPELCPEPLPCSADEFLFFIREVGFYHDIGKIMIPIGIINKQGALTREEYEEIKKHTVYIDTLLTPLLDAVSFEERPFLKAIIETGHAHHERWDGRGYPDGRRGPAIPFVARVCAICDAYDAMTSRRIYSAARSPLCGIAEIEAGAGTQFDPLLASIFPQCAASLTQIRELA
jgi:HD-GYP domain-containing protein (c-di-GMP phosphodiesterase class II)